MSYMESGTRFGKGKTVLGGGRPVWWVTLSKEEKSEIDKFAKRGVKNKVRKKKKPVEEVSSSNPTEHELYVAREMKKLAEGK